MVFCADFTDISNHVVEHANRLTTSNGVRTQCFRPVRIFCEKGDRIQTIFGDQVFERHSVQIPLKRARPLRRRRNRILPRSLTRVKRRRRNSLIHRPNELNQVFLRHIFDGKQSRRNFIVGLFFLLLEIRRIRFHKKHVFFLSHFALCQIEIRLGPGGGHMHETHSYRIHIDFRCFFPFFIKQNRWTRDRRPSLNFGRHSQMNLPHFVCTVLCDFFQRREFRVLLEFLRH